MTTTRCAFGMLLLSACATTATTGADAPAAARGGPWNDAATGEIDEYMRAEYAKWLAGDVEAIQSSAADDLALIYDVDMTGTPVRIVGAQAVRSYAAGLGAFLQASGMKGTVDAQTCRATANAGLCTTEFHFDMALPGGATMTMKQRGTCIAAKGERGWRWAHCHVSAAEWPEMPAVKLMSQHVNKDGLKWQKTPAGFEMAPVWQNPVTGGFAGFARFGIEFSDQTVHYHHGTSLSTVIKGKMTHWTEGGGMHETGPGGFVIVPGGRGGAHTSAIDQDTLVFSVFDKGWDRVGVADEAAAATAAPPEGEAPWDAKVAGELEAFSREQMAAWEAVDLDRISATLADASLPAFDLDMQGKPVRLASRDEQLAFARAFKESGVTAKMRQTASHCRGAGDFGWCAVDFAATAPGPDGKPMEMSLRITAASARIDGAWKTVHWHGSMAAIPGPPAPPLRSVEAKDLKWQELPGTGGVKLAVVWEDPATKGIAGFVQMPKAWKGFPNHFHSANMHYTVLRGVHAHVEPGGDRRETREGGAGFEVAKNIHRTEGKDGLMIFIVTDAPFDAVLVDDKGNPLPPPAGEPAKKK